MSDLEHDDHEFGGHHHGDHGFGHGFGGHDHDHDDHDPFGGHHHGNGHHGSHGGHHDKWDKHSSKHKGKRNSLYKSYIMNYTSMAKPRLKYVFILLFKSDKYHKDKYGRKSGGHGSHSKYGKGSLWSSSHSSHSHSRHFGHSYDNDDDDEQHDNVCNWVTMGRESEEVLEKDISDKVEHEWKAAYYECSAKDPEAVTHVFKSLMQELEEVGYGNGRSTGPYGGYTQGRHDSDHEPLRKCVIL